MNNQYPFEIKRFSYDYDSLEPYIDSETMRLHYSKHLLGYVTKLNDLLKQEPQYQDLTLEELCLNKEVPQNIKNQAGGVWNHNFFFECLSKHNPFININTILKQQEAKDIFEEFQQKALSLFGSGYTYLVYNKTSTKIESINIKNQDIPDLEVYTPILCCDLWEHAYYLKNHNKRNKYFLNWLNVINWEKIKNNYEKILKETENEKN